MKAAQEPPLQKVAHKNTPLTALFKLSFRSEAIVREIIWGETYLKPKVYIETSILSYLTARQSNDLRVATNQNITLEWWERSSHNLA